MEGTNLVACWWGQVKCSKTVEFLTPFMLHFNVSAKALLILSAFLGSIVVYICACYLSQEEGAVEQILGHKELEAYFNCNFKQNF